MTAMPEALLAREAEICYAGIAIITNYAAGIKEKRLTAKEVIEIMHKTTGQIGELIKEGLSLITMQRACACKEALKEAKV
jgi:5'-methylthioadenosine phosphorylase